MDSSVKEEKVSNPKEVLLIPGIATKEVLLSRGIARGHSLTSPPKNKVTKSTKSDFGGQPQGSEEVTKPLTQK